jgi:hypothetical protein
MLEFFVIGNVVYIMKDHNYESLWKHFIKKGIKTKCKATDLAEGFKSQTIMLYAVFVHGKEHMDRVMDKWKLDKDDDKVNDLIIKLGATKYGKLIEELIYQEITMQNVLSILQICLVLIRRVQFTENHQLIREFLNENPEMPIVEL